MVSAPRCGEAAVDERCGKVATSVLRAWVEVLAGSCPWVCWCAASVVAGWKLARLWVAPSVTEAIPLGSWLLFLSCFFAVMDSVETFNKLLSDLSVAEGVCAKLNERGWTTAAGSYWAPEAGAETTFQRVLEAASVDVGSRQAAQTRVWLQRLLCRCGTCGNHIGALW